MFLNECHDLVFNGLAHTEEGRKLLGGLREFGLLIWGQLTLLLVKSCEVPKVVGQEKFLGAWRDIGCFTLLEQAPIFLGSYLDKNMGITSIVNKLQD